MNDELLADILAAERDIHLQIESLEQQTEKRLESLRQELEQLLADETGALQAEVEQARARAAQAAEGEAAMLLAEAKAFAMRLANLDSVELDRIILRYLPRIQPEGADDRHNEQA